MTILTWYENNFVVLENSVAKVSDGLANWQIAGSVWN